MSNPNPWLKVAVVRTVPDVQCLVDLLGDYLPACPVSLYLNFEGIRSRGDGVHAQKMVLFIRPRSIVYVVDLQELGDTALLTPGTNGKQTLKSILQSDEIPKAIFDVRDPYLALGRQLNITWQNVHDIQLMELASRNADLSKQYLSGLDKCIAEDGSVNPAVDLPSQPPIPLVFDPRILQLPELWAKYYEKLATKKMAFWVYMIREAVKNRLGKPSGDSSASAKGSTVSDNLGTWSAKDIENERRKWCEGKVWTGFTEKAFTDGDLFFRTLWLSPCVEAESLDIWPTRFKTKKGYM